METLGSQRLLQIAVNKRPELLHLALKKSGALRKRESVTWTCPLAGDLHKEYRDMAAIRKLGLMPTDLNVPLADFWPPRGAVWDGLGITSNSRPLLLEAKAHIPEAASPGTRASPKSRQLIEASLKKTRRHFAPRASSDWMGTFYQYANRLAFHYYLRVLNHQDSILVFLDFTNAADMDGPSTQLEWQGATRMIHAVLGLPADLTRFGVYHAYVDARALTDTM